MSKEKSSRIFAKFFEQTGASAVLLNDPNSVSCCTGLEFPFATHFPEKPLGYLFSKNASSLLICPYEWTQAVLDQGWTGGVRSYDDQNADPFAYLAEQTADFLKTVFGTGEAGKERAKGKPVAVVGLEGQYISAAFQQDLDEACPDLQWVDTGQLLRDVRMIKDKREIELLRTSAEKLEFGLIGALQHLEGSLEENGYTLPEFCERIRVHVYETGGTAGGIAAAPAGRGGTVWYGLPRGKFAPGELIRIEASSRYMGYWAYTSRMMTIGEATDIQKRAYRENLLLKERVVEMLSPGVKASNIFETVEELAAAEGIDFRPEFGVGHGIGTAEMEAPYLIPSDETVLREGMCIVVAVYTEGPGKELVCSKDTYCIQSGDPQCVSWYHNWEELYEVTGFRSAH